MHGDIHYAEVMVNCNGNVKSIDFGCAESDASEKSFDIEILEDMCNDIHGAKPFTN